MLVSSFAWPRQPARGPAGSQSLNAEPDCLKVVDTLRQAALELGVDINVNSTTGGDHDPRSDHYIYEAIDINRIDHRPVGDPTVRDLVERLQDFFAQQPYNRENFGPTRNDKAYTPRGKRIPTPSAAAKHRDHVHLSLHVNQ